MLMLVLVALVTPASLEAMQAAPAQAKPAAQAQAPAAKPAPPAQAPAKPAPVEAQTPPPPPPTTAPASETYTYDPASRRDPFLNLLTGGTEPRLTSRKGEGAAGLSVNEISVRGVMESRGGFIAMVQGPDNKTYMIHQGDKLLDGVVRAVNAEGLVIVQEVNDPLSLVKQREVSKKLRSLEAKE